MFGIELVKLPFVIWALHAILVFGALVSFGWFSIAARKPKYWVSEKLCPLQRLKWGWTWNSDYEDVGDTAAERVCCSFLGFDVVVLLFVATVVSILSAEGLLDIAIIGCLLIVSPFAARWVLDVARGLRHNKSTGDLETVKDIESRISQLERELAKHK